MAENAQEIRPCGLLRRLAALVYDGMVVLALWMLAAALVLPLTAGEAVPVANVFFQGYLLAVAWIYCAICWRLGGQTLGMRAWRIFLTAPKAPIGWGRALARFILAWLSALVLGLGFVWALFNRRRATWHDLVTDTFLEVRRPVTSDRRPTEP